MVMLVPFGSTVTFTQAGRPFGPEGLMSGYLCSVLSGSMDGQVGHYIVRKTDWVLSRYISGSVLMQQESRGNKRRPMRHFACYAVQKCIGCKRTVERIRT